MLEPSVASLRTWAPRAWVVMICGVMLYLVFVTPVGQIEVDESAGPVVRAMVPLLTWIPPAGATYVLARIPYQHRRDDSARER